MEHKKIAPILAIALMLVGASVFSVPRVQAFHVANSEQWHWAGTVVKDYSDDYLGFINYAGREGQPVTLTATIATSSSTGQRNLTLGVKFDWMTSWVNSSVVAVQPDRQAAITVTVTMPTVASTPGVNLVRHDWEARIWNTDGTTKVTSTTCTGDGNNPPCVGSGLRTDSFAVYSNDQADGITARREAQNKIDALAARLALTVLASPPAGWSKASSDISQAQAEIATGDTLYDEGNFNAAKSRYQSALNLANSAAGALGGGESGSYFGSWFTGVGWLLIGVAAVLLGFGGFMYLSKRKG